MQNIFFISDTHFSHEKAITFLNYDGSRMRPFNTWEEADELMIENWNKTIKPQDKVYHLGDVVLSKNKGDLILPRLNGTKILIKGNHDLHKPTWYLQYFKDIRACHNLHITGEKYNFLLTHIPVHPNSKARFIRNLHGHIHGNIIEDKWYRNCCVDLPLNNYTPIPYELILEETEELIENNIIQIPREREESI